MKSITLVVFPLIYCLVVVVFNLPTALSFAPTGVIPFNVQRISSSTKPFSPPLSASSIITPTGRKKKVSSSSFKNLNYALLKKRLALQNRLLGKRSRHRHVSLLPSTISAAEPTVTTISTTTALTRTEEAVVQEEDSDTTTTTTTTTTSSSSSSFQETAVRSAVKALMWRIIAGSVTFMTTLKFSNGSVTTALSLVGSDFVSKLMTMFIGERIMNRSSAGRNTTTGSDSAKRSFIKALIWRLFAICNTLTMAICISKDWTIASKIAGSDAILKTMMMFVYERAWSQIQWGQQQQRMLL